LAKNRLLERLFKRLLVAAAADMPRKNFMVAALAAS
jgi:hypothetical protein